MVVVELENYSLSVRSSILLDTVNVRVSDGQRVALVGPNGCGKSTLLRALARPDSLPDTTLGRTRRSESRTSSSAGSDGGGGSGGGCGGGYFTTGAGKINGIVRSDPSQVLLVEQDLLRWAELLPGVDEAEARAMTVPDALELAAALAEDGDGDGAVDDVEQWRRLCVAAGDALEWRIAHYETTAIGHLSPGCAVRAYLAIALMRSNVKLLLLDEPTNHLDLPSIMWLERAVVASGKTVIFVSHDEAFLDAVADHIWDIDPDKHAITVSGAGFSALRAAQEVAKEQQRAAFDAQQKRHQRLTAVAEKLKTKSTAGAMSGMPDRDKLQRDFRRDRAGRSGQKAKSIATRRDKEPVVEAVVDHIPLQIHLEPVAAGGNSSILLKEVVLGHDGAPLPLPPVTVRVDFGERIAVVGFNGAGKSTLLRTIVGDLSPVRGEATVGRDLRVGVLAQEHESMPRDATPREYLSALVGPDDPHAGWRLLKFGITRQQLDSPIRELNPGARARALLAGFSLRRVNTLILDEPTNHLDEEAVAEVLATINDFKGTVIVVSHSRHFLESMNADRVHKLHPGGLDEIDSVQSFIDDVEDRVASTLETMF